MIVSSSNFSYTGKGVQNPEEQMPKEIWDNLSSNDKLNDPAQYVAPTGLAEAVNVALELGVPLLLTGEPGCGKSQLAHSLVWELGFPKESAKDLWPKPLTYTVKSDTQSRDLFYSFDTLGRFRAAHAGDATDAHHYLRFEALGLAFLRALGLNAIYDIDPDLAEAVRGLVYEPQRSVVLIDEIDKAPREVPNDILNEIDHMCFDIPELFKVNADKSRTKPVIALQGSPLRPIVVITSNRERELPEAFLRRCVYYHLELPPFRKDASTQRAPDNGITIEDIVQKRLRITISRRDENSPNHEKSIWPGGISFFAHLRDARLQKAPSTAELLNWLLLLKKRCDPSATLATNEIQDLFFSSAKVTLFKHKEDQNRAERLFIEWLNLTSNNP